MELNWPHLSFPPSAVTKGRHEMVPKDIREEAEKYAKVSSSPVVNISVHSALSMVHILGCITCFSPMNSCPLEINLFGSNTPSFYYFLP